MDSFRRPIISRNKLWGIAVKKPRFAVVAVVASTFLSACSTVIEGTSQQVAVNSFPAGASCVASRGDEMLASNAMTPFAINVDKTRADIKLTCVKDGYVPKNVVVESDFAAMTVGNVVAGGLVGLVIDVADGADNKYSSNINIALAPEPASAHGPQPASLALPQNPASFSLPQTVACQQPDATMADFAREHGYQYHSAC